MISANDTVRRRQGRPRGRPAPTSTATCPGPRRSAHAAFSPDGHTLLIDKAGDVYSGEKGRAYLIDPDIDRVTARLCDLVGATITADQWHRYFPGMPYRPPCR
ncbi:hypothetical protein [Streptomyces sp. CBMA123]|uniref:hypothetical protein n=1 Tax=Streptomyces sp. CBMA123 TaxID=1896313 RepID=UPI0016619475|nr:hypothetical protein [Streptomyces sp. CBMA123]